MQPYKENTWKALLTLIVIFTVGCIVLRVLEDGFSGIGFIDYLGYFLAAVTAVGGMWILLKVLGEI